jgi:hypothetical protein
MGYILLIIAFIAILAVIGLGWKTFFAGVQRGADKIGLTPIIQNLTHEAKQSVTAILRNESSGIISKVLTPVNNGT